MSDDMRRAAVKAATCETCRWWSEDDDPDAERMGCCVILLNDPAARGFHTRPGYGCRHHAAAHSAKPDGVP
jgi:hypothetical protein